VLLLLQAAKDKVATAIKVKITLFINDYFKLVF
jgi:hypothetical protein